MQAPASMNIIQTTCTGTVILIIFLMVRISVELTWMTEKVQITSCEGQDQLLMWNYSLEENETVEAFQWFFNEMAICYQSESKGLLVLPKYLDRIKRFGTTGIQLKKVAVNDTGEYIFYPKLAEEQSINIQKINLIVYEIPAYHCRPKITSISKNLLICSTKSCERPHLSSEWRILGKPDSVGNESYFAVNSSWNADLVFCCLHGPDMKCHIGDQFEFCTSHIFSTEQVYENTGSTSLVTYVLMSLLILTVLSIVLVCVWKKLKSVVLTRTKNANNCMNEETTMTTELLTVQRALMSTCKELPEEIPLHRHRTVNVGDVEAEAQLLMNAQSIGEKDKKQETPNILALALDSSNLANS